MDLIFCLSVELKIKFISIIIGNLIFIKLIKIHLYYKNLKKIIKLKWTILLLIFLFLNFKFKH